MKTRICFVVLTGLLCCNATVSLAQGNSNGGNGNKNPPPGFCRNVEQCIEELGLGGGFADPDWEVQGDNMQAIPTGNVGVGAAPHVQIKFGTVTDDPNVRFSGSFYKQSSAAQIGESTGVRGLTSDHPNRGTGVYGQASSLEANAQSTGLAGRAAGGGNAHFGVSAVAIGDATKLSIGLQAVSASNTDVQYGVFGVSGLSTHATSFNAGVRAIGYGSNVTANGRNYGIHVTANPGTSTDTNIGVFTRAMRPPSNIPGMPTTNYGIYAYADGDGLNNLAGFFNGDICVTGMFTCSDANLKHDIQPAESDALDMIRQLKPKKYKYRQDIPEFVLPEGTQYGFIAQDLEPLFPHLVRESTRPPIVDEEGMVTAEFHYKSVNYVGLIPVMAQAIQEQQAQIDDLKAELKEMRGD